jgi:hypothetical protein
MLAVRSQGTWSVFYFGTDGKRRPARDVLVPPEVTESELVDYLADLCHEWGTKQHPEVKKLSDGA